MIRSFASAVAAVVTLTLASWARAGSHVPSHSSSTYHGPSYTPSLVYKTPVVNYKPAVTYYKPPVTYINTSVTNYQTLYGKTFSYGIYYPGLNHYQWTSRSWYARYGCYCYWCPSARSWYYWCAPRRCYYPIGYINMVAPGATDAPAEATALYGPMSPAPAPLP